MLFLEIHLKQFQSRVPVHLWSWDTKYHITSRCSWCRELLFKRISTVIKVPWNHRVHPFVCLSVRPSATVCHCNCYRTEGFPQNLMLEIFKRTCWEIANRVKIGQKYRAFYMKAEKILIDVGYIRTVGRVAQSFSDCLRAERFGDRIPVWRDFPHLSKPALGPTQPPVQWVPALSRG